VAEHLDLSLPTVSRMINGLVQRGFIQRRASQDDRRHVSLSVRPRGQAIMQQAREATQDFLKNQFQGLTCEQCEALITAMQALRQVFEHDMPHPVSDGQAELVETR
jgi:MarR family transcriptional regulator for hemolysin